ncbi:MAG TPA: aminoglycoside phosphotransferase family protein [Anaerolinea sp.]|nr:aminoglycoside phosphotransferase family protein [Anaerolinea sp.]
MLEMIGEGRSAQVFAWDQGRGLKLFYSDARPDWLEREFRATDAAYRAGVPVPRPYEMIEYEGRQGIIYERIDGVSGVTLFRRKPWLLVPLVRQVARLQAQTLQVRAPDLPPLRDALRATIQRGIQGGFTEPEARQILARLDALPDGDRLCHMDFHPDNVMQTSRGWVIIDWMNALSGPPLADVARSSVILKVSGPPPGASGGMMITLGSRLAYLVYSREIRARMRFAERDLRAWILPVAAARLVENIPGERPRLIEIIRRGLHG